MYIAHDFEGANPPSNRAIENPSASHFVLRPWSEDGDGGYLYRLNVRIVNEETITEQAHLTLEWGDDDPENMRDRGHVLLGRGASWRHVDGRVEGDRSVVSLAVPPGEWYLGLCPRYDLDAYAADREQMLEAGFVERVYGRSYEGRNLSAYYAGPADAPAMLIVSRFHPYETAGSYCMSGVQALLGEDLAVGGPLTASRCFVLVPVPNPDGVALGCCKRTRQGGPDLAEGVESDDPAALAFARLLAETMPGVCIDFHGRMVADRDWVIYSDQRAMDTLRPALDAPEFDRPWELTSFARRQYPQADFRHPMAYEYGATTFVFGPSFFYRQPEQMRNFGRRLLPALCAIPTE